MKTILQREHPVLREVARSVPVADIASAEIQNIIAEMSASMSLQRDGVAIAAPQIGANLRIFVVSGALLRKADKSYKGDGSDLIFINPELVRSSRDKKEVEEGCLSVRWLYGKVRRSCRVTIRAYDQTGKKIERGASGLLAQIFQHEIDHLNGILFTDKAKEVWEMTEEEIREAQRS